MIVSFIKVAAVGTSKFDTQLPLAARDSKGKLKFRSQRYIRFPDIPLTLVKGLKVLLCVLTRILLCNHSVVDIYDQ